MSSAPDPHGHDAHDAHAFTGEPTQTLPADEPRTPGWLPLLGIALFTGAAVIFLAGRDPSPEAAAPGAAPPAPPSPPASVVVRPQGPPPSAPAGATAPAIQKLTPEQRAQLLKEMGKAQPPAPAH